MILHPTPEQQAVADYPLRPLRVTAGAGTGKTTTMALRLAALIRREAIAPEEALGITFTNKAAEELADRLRRHLPELAREGRQVEVATYHGFAFGLLAEFGPLVGIERGVGVITPGYTRQLLREALGSGPHRALDLTSPGARVNELAGLAGRLGDHLLEPGALLEDDGDDDEVGARRAEMAEVLAVYARRKRDLGLVDYADMISRGHRLLSTHPEVADRLRSRYRVVLLDEYQDTNPAQREVLRLIFGAGFPVTAVGDPDQTIYEWRGASLENFEAFPAHFPEQDGTPAATLTLSFNRRSASRIVDLANLVRGQIGRPSGLDCLRALPDAPPGRLETGWYHSSVEEAEAIARRLADLHESGEIAWRDIGVLFRRHRDIGLVRQALEQQEIPVEVASLGGLLEVPEVADLHAWLGIIGRPDDDASLMRVLLGTRYRLGLGDLAPLAAWRARPRPGESEAAGLGRAMLEAFDHLEECPGLSAEAGRRLEGFRAAYRRLLGAAQGMSLVELCRRVLDEIGAWPEVEALNQAARLSARLNLYRFLDLAEAWSPLEGAPSLQAFLDYLDLLGEDGSAEELDTARVSGEDAVVLLTVHRAKGLEWPVVVVPALGKGTFPVKAHALEDPLAQPQYLPHHRRLDRVWLPDLPADPKQRTELFRCLHEDQEWRTAYVAVTRAMRHLLLTGAFWYTEKKPREPSPLLDLAASVPGVETIAAAADAGVPPSTLRLDPKAEGPDPFFPAGWRAALRTAVTDPTSPGRLAEEKGIAGNFAAAAAEVASLLEGLPKPLPEAAGAAPLRTTVTGLVTFASCPLRFHWSAADRLPRRPAPQLRRGIDVHRRIELHNRGGLPLEEAAEAFYDFAAGEAHGAGGDPFAVFGASRFAASPPRLVEAPFELAIGETRVAGRIDAIYEGADGAWEVVDFKSGRRSADPSRRVQLEAYALAVAEAGFAAGPPARTRVTFAHLGGGRLEEESEEVDDAWLRRARDHLADLTTRAAAGERAPTPAESCRDCDFARFCPEGTAWLAAHP
ncbi:MAG TPA: ATP-dependent DNA helicase [Acidimicrobiia bacterium]|nr:ATP-dependent DNA helicase [Acidimicrobiia bacterium]